MRETTNFKLTIPEGSDDVNILTQITPNFESIDTIMKGNENAGVQVATVLYSNNIHAITRTKDDASVMRFTATSRFTLGDTFTVDGVQVTALAPTGEQLPDGAFIVGSEVLAILKGTLLTVFAGAKASDSAKLNGQSASFYATKAEVDNAQDLAEGAATIAQDALDRTSPKDFAIAQIIGKFNGKNVYRRILKGRTGSGNSIGGYTSQSVSNIDMLISLNIICHGSQSFVPTFYAPNQYISGYLTLEGRGVVITSDPDLYNRDFVMVIEYTLASE